MLLSKPRVSDCRKWLVGALLSALDDGLPRSGVSLLEAREEAQKLGFVQFEMSAGLNDSPRFIQALGQIVREAMGQTVHTLTRVKIAAEKLVEPQFAAASGLD